MQKGLVLDGRKIGETHPCFIIAEAGVNFNGDLEIAKRMIDVAAESGVDAIKFQTFEAEKLVTQNASAADYQIENTQKQQSQFELLKKLELKKEFHSILKSYAENKNLIFLSTPFDEGAIDFLDELGVKAYKAGSSELNNLPYLKKMAKKNKPMIVSTGMSTMREIKEAQDVITEANNDLIFLHCTTSYPCPLNEVNLNAMNNIKEETGCLVGYSDHTEGILVPIIAASMGATVIEKHFTLDRTMEGPDHLASIEPNELKEMVKKIRLVEKIKGKFEKEPTQSEKRIQEVARKSIVAARDIEPNTQIEEEMIVIKRPGTGISPRYMDKIIGKKAQKKIKRHDIIEWGDIY